MASSEKLYQYQLLPTATSIRLLRLKAINNSDDFTCTLEVVDLTTPPEYIALSYFWGDTSVQVPIKCDGGVVMVTPTIRSMLRKFCVSIVGVWADAVCINQADIAERNQQVAIMADIYRKAATVAVWLGHDPHNDVEVVTPWLQDFINKIARVDGMGARLTEMDTENGEVTGILPNGRHVSATLNIDVAFPTEEGEERLRRFFSQPWFSRTWVIQEVGLAAEVSLVWEDKASEWNPIGLVAMYLVRYGRAWLKMNELTDVIENVYHIYTAYSPFTPRATFFHLLNSARRFKALDPRDKVFALLSHWSAHEIMDVAVLPMINGTYQVAMELGHKLMPSTKDQWLIQLMNERRDELDPQFFEQLMQKDPIIKADYNKTVMEVYQEVTVEHIKRTKFLEMLAAVQHDPIKDELPSPSWVPRWDEYIGCAVLGLINNGYVAAAGREAICTLPSPTNPHTLVVRGTIISRITYSSSLISTANIDDFHTHNGRPLATRLVDNPISYTWDTGPLKQDHEAGKLYPLLPSGITESGHFTFEPQSTILEAYLRTCVAGKGTLALPKIGFEPESDNGYNFKQDSKKYWKRLYSPARTQPVWTDWEADEDEIMRSERYTNAVLDVVNQRKLFVTAKRLIGLGPGALRVGDWVALVLGLDVPVVLREVGADERGPGPFPEDVRFQLVGECYVDGLMKGEGTVGARIERDIVVV